MLLAYLSRKGISKVLWYLSTLSTIAWNGGTSVLSTLCRKVKGEGMGHRGALGRNYSERITVLYPSAQTSQADAAVAIIHLDAWVFLHCQQMLLGPQEAHDLYTFYP